MSTVNLSHTTYALLVKKAEKHVSLSIYFQLFLILLGEYLTFIVNFSYSEVRCYHATIDVVYV
jgi:hypothetical protein